MTAIADWRETTIGALASVTRGASPRPIASSRWFDSNSDVRWVRIADVNRSNGRTLLATTQALSPDGIARSRYLRPGTLIMSIAATVGIPVITGVPTCIHDGFVALENLKVDQRFLLYLLKASESRLHESGQSGSQMNVNTDIVKGFGVCIPAELSEQQRIADALWDADDLIVTLERLSTKKQAIKQGMMQHLLGLSATRNWAPIRMQELVQAMFSGPSPTCEERTIRGPEWGVLKTTCATWQSGWNPAMHKVLPIAFWGRKSIEVHVGDSIVTKAGPRHRVGVPAYVSAIQPQIVPSGKMICVRPNQARVLPGFLSLALADRRTQAFLDQRSTGMAESQVNFENADLRAAPIWLPSLEDQRHILEALTDIDSQIATLDARLTKTRDIKTGTMQQLLTGRTRLPVMAAS